MTDRVDDIERELALLAGEAFARLRLEPEGYGRVAIESLPLAGFDQVYEHDGNVVLVDTLAADQQLDAVHAMNGQVVEAGTRSYVELMIANMRARAPDAARMIEAALTAGRLRYYEVRQPFEDDGQLADIVVRQFAL